MDYFLKKYQRRMVDPHFKLEMITYCNSNNKKKIFSDSVC